MFVYEDSRLIGMNQIIVIRRWYLLVEGGLDAVDLVVLSVAANNSLGGQYE